MIQFRSERVCRVFTEMFLPLRSQHSRSSIENKRKKPHQPEYDTSILLPNALEKLRSREKESMWTLWKQSAEKKIYLGESSAACLFLCDTIQIDLLNEKCDEMNVRRNRTAPNNWMKNSNEKLKLPECAPIFFEFNKNFTLFISRLGYCFGKNVKLHKSFLNLILLHSPPQPCFV